MKLDDLEICRGFYRSDYYKPVMILLAELVEKLEKKIVSFDLASGSDRELILLKMEAQGAKKLLKAFQTDVEALSKQS